MTVKPYHLTISDIQCVDCENNIEEAILALPGIIRVSASFTDESVRLELDTDVISIKTVCAAIKKAGYTCGKPKKKAAGLGKRVLLILLAVIGILLLLQLNSIIPAELSLQNIGEKGNYGLLFVVGMLTSFHCVGMCGGFVLSYTVARSHAFLNHLSYGLGKTLSYAAFGALFGFLGGAISFTLGLRSLALIGAGVFMILYGLSMLDAFRGLRRLQIRLPRFLVHALVEKRKHLSNPLLIGLLNGLMVACGPLQAMYIMAAGTGSPMQGAALLTVFALGTLPTLFAFGYLAGMITANTTRHFLKFSALIIMLLGAVMLNRGMLIAGTGYDLNSLLTRVAQNIKTNLMSWQQVQDRALPPLDYQVIYTEAEKQAYLPPEYMLQKNVPVKWIINVKELSTCNRQIIIPAMGMTIDLKEGLQMVEFVPKESGIISWSCSMGMIPGTFIVKD